jgi:REP element-mobilizing transposase RayT
VYRVQEIYPFFLYAFVVMPDHCHLLLRTSEAQSLSTIMRVYKGGVAHNIGKGPIWQSRFDAKIIRRNPHAVIAYIHQNPVKAGLVRTAEEYRWSSASRKWDVADV